MKDVDEINQKLWARKKLKKRRDRNETKRVRKNYFKHKDDLGEELVDEKKS